MTSQRSTQSYKYSVAGKRAKDALNIDEQELYELCCLAGVEMSPAVYRIIMNLLKMNVSPIAIVQMLKSMVNPKASIVAAPLTLPSSMSDSSVMTGTGSLAGHSGAKRSASASSVSGGYNTARSLKGTSRSGTNVRSDGSSRSRSTKSSTSTKS